MGLFGKLFDKKVCDLCGGDIGLLGNRKLEDGNMCKNCAKKLSPWFSDRRNSTVEEIRAQLEYREANKEAVANFRTTRTYGEGTKLLLDEDAGKFMVTDCHDLAEANPDVLAFSDVTGCILDIEEDKTEIMREDKDGNEISYNPPRFCYEYDFYVTIHVRNPYFDEIRFQLNDSTVEMEHTASANVGMGASKVGFAAPARMSAAFNPERNGQYRRYKEMGEEIKDALLQIRQQVREDAAAASAPKLPVTCPGCGATTTPDDSNCCEYCGSYLGN